MPRRAALILALAAAVCAAAPALGAADPRRGDQWNLTMVRSDEAQRTTRGEGAIVAVIDSGAQLDHPDLRGRLLPAIDYVGKDPDDRSDDDGVPEDGNGHGTHVTGIIAANSGNGVGVASVAPGAHVMPFRALDDEGGGYVADVSIAIDEAVKRRVDVINLSIGEEVPLSAVAGGDSALRDSVRKAVAANVVVVFASGNNGVPFCEQPEATEGILCVGAVDRRGMRSFFSSFGPGLSLVAPGGAGTPVRVRGENVLSTYIRSGYREVAGTSQAAPHVSGVAALLASMGMRGRAAVNRILSTATDAGPAGHDTQYGAGIVNAAEAVKGLKKPDLPPANVAVGRTHRIRTVEKRGIRANCRPRRSGRCSIRITMGGRTIASGSATVTAGRYGLVTLRLNSYGRRQLKKVKKSVSVRLTASIPGARSQQRLLKLVR